MDRTFKLTVAYDGTHFAGWQVQPEKPTIQGVLERAFEQITQQSVRVIGSGRTDSGVHATGQVASCVASNWRAPAENLGRALNTKLPDSVTVVSVEDAVDGFHAIRDAIGKRYRYQIKMGGCRDPFNFRYHWQLHWPLDLEAIGDAARRIEGRQDFASFQATGADRKTTVRHVRACTVSVLPGGRIGPAGSPPAEPHLAGMDGARLLIEVEADGFLYNMVRNIVGSLVEVGRGKRSPQWISDVIAAKNRDLAGPTAPPQGLFLGSVQYDASVLVAAQRPSRSGTR